MARSEYVAPGQRAGGPSPCQRMPGFGGRRERVAPTSRGRAAAASGGAGSAPSANSAGRGRIVARSFEGISQPAWTRKWRRCSRLTWPTGCRCGIQSRFGWLIHPRRILRCASALGRTRARMASLRRFQRILPRRPLPPRPLFQSRLARLGRPIRPGGFSSSQCASIQSARTTANSTALRWAL